MIQIVSFLYKCKTPCPTLQITLIWEHNYKEKLKTRIFTCEHVNHNYIVRESCSLGRFGWGSTTSMCTRTELNTLNVRLPSLERIIWFSSSTTHIPSTAVCLASFPTRYTGPSIPYLQHYFDDRWASRYKQTTFSVHYACTTISKTFINELETT